MSIDREDSMTLVNITYELPRDEAEFWMFCNASKMRSVLWEIASTCRTAYKHRGEYSLS